MSLCRPATAALAALSILLLGASTLDASAQGKKKKPGAQPAASAAKLAAAGKKVYNANGCTACHAIGDKGGKTGPDLTTIGADHKADWLADKIRDPKKATPDSLMPAYPEDKISGKDLKAVVAYMLTLKK